MTLSIALVAILVIAAAAGLFARNRASGLRGGGARLNSLPNYHGFYVALWAALPALLFLSIWNPIQTGLVDQAVLASPAGKALPDFDLARDTILTEARQIATGEIEAGFNPESSELAPVYASASARFAAIGGGISIVIALLGAFLSMRRIKVDFRARSSVERWVMGLLLAASLIAILTTLGIVLSLLFESLRFFEKVSPIEFLFGTTWSPQMAIRADQAGSSGAFGSIPLFWGTAFIGAIIAMIVVIPLGLMSAIFLTQYSPPKLRSWLKPILEILAGVPTVVYGYFAALTVAPIVRDFGLSIGISSASSESALAAGLVMGIMIIPFVSSMADDSIAAVPQAMRDGSLAMNFPKDLIVVRAEGPDLGRMVPQDAPHQGVVIEVEPLEELWLADVLAEAPERAVLLVLDQVTDPHNVGAIIRTAAAFGAIGIVTQDRHAPPESGALAKAASGALERVPWVRVVNLARALEEIAEAGFWRIGLAGQATTELKDALGPPRVALVLGAEGPGMRSNTREHCDALAKLPISDAVESLNVSNAAAVALYAASVA